MSGAERKISAVPEADGDRITGVDVRLATLEDQAASLRAEVASLRDDIHWLSGAAEEEEELSWLARGWVRASLLLATVGAVAVASLPYLLHSAPADSVHMPVAESRPAPIVQPAAVIPPSPESRPAPVAAPVIEPAPAIQPARVIQPAPPPVPLRNGAREPIVKSAPREPAAKPARVRRVETPEPARVVPAETARIPAPQPRLVQEVQPEPRAAAPLGPTVPSAPVVPAPSRGDSSP
jgi:hypothetical protein